MYKVSFYEGNIKNASTSKVIEIGEYVSFVKYGTYKNISDEVSAIKDKKQRQTFKGEHLPYVTTSGVFSYRSKENLLEYSGLICMDFDDFDTKEELDLFKEELTKDRHSFVVFKSVSGNGLSVFVKTSKDAEDHKKHFDWLTEYYWETYGKVVDPTCSDICRARFVSFDPDIFINEKAKAAGKKNPPKTKPKKIGWVATESQMHRIVTDIYNTGVNLTQDSYILFRNIGFAIADGFGEGGRQYFHAIASVSSLYNEKQADRQYTYCLKNGNIKVGTFFYLAKEAGIALSTKEEESIFSIAKAAKKGNSNVEGAIATAKAHGLDVKMTEEVATKVFERDDIDLSDKTGSIMEEITSFLLVNADLRLNEMTNQLEANGSQITDRIFNTIYARAKAATEDRASQNDVKAIMNSEFIQSYHPLEEWVEKHKHLPEKPEVIEQMVNTLPYKDPRAKIFVRQWLLGIPATSKGETVRLVLCLMGGNETGKTSWFRRLLPDDLQDYFAESKLDKPDEAALLMSSNLIIMDDELGGTSQKDAKRFKELTSKENFSLRLSYDKYLSKLRRVALLCGNTNDFQIINDTTGNTRMMPVEFNVLYDTELYNSIDKTQLLIELFRAHERGEDWRLPPEGAELLKELTGSYSVADFEGELVDDFFDTPPEGVNGLFLTSTEIKIILERSTGQKIMSTRKLGIALNNRFNREVKWVNGKTKRGYNCVLLKSDSYLSEAQYVN